MMPSFPLEERLDWKQLATFVPNKKEPIYNWFYYKEGFAKELVFRLIAQFGLNRGQWVLDPFAGSGTTLLACKQQGINAVGVDAHPLLAFVAAVKTRDYDVTKLRNAAKELLSKKFEPTKLQFPLFFNRAFNKHSLDDIAFFKTHIDMMGDSLTRDFFTLALINATMKVSYAWKDGGVIKIKKHPVPPFRKLFRRVLVRMIKDVDKTGLEGSDIIVKNADARRLQCIDNASIDSVITSPPYLNQINYTKIYEIESFFIGASKPAVRSTIGSYEADLPHDDMPPQAHAYFADMTRAFEELFRICKEGAQLGIVIGNAYFPGSIIESDLELAEIADTIGFTVKKIVVLNKRFALENRTEKKGTLRESLVLLEK